jgi:hypothetical protein
MSEEEIGEEGRGVEEGESHLFVKLFVKLLRSEDSANEASSPLSARLVHIVFEEQEEIGRDGDAVESEVSLHDCTLTWRCANLEMDQLEDLQFLLPPPYLSSSQ